MQYRMESIVVNGIKDGEEYNTYIWRADCAQWCWEVRDYKGEVIKNGKAPSITGSMTDAESFMKEYVPE